MRNYFFKFVIFASCIGLFIFLVGQQAQAQEGKNLSFNDILVRLTFTSRISKSTEEINKQLITDVGKRKVNFILTTEDEDALEKAGGNDLLIKKIRESLPKEIEAKLIELKAESDLYKKFTDNYNGTLKQRKIAIEAGKEFMKRYGNDKDAKDIITYLKAIIPELESQIAVYKD